MQRSRIGMTVDLGLPYAEAIRRTTEALKTEGFGVLTTIDVQATLEQKLGVSFRPYTILGACNPPLAHRALQADLSVGLMLPCNVVVYETEPGSSAVAAISPMSAIAAVGDAPELRDVAQDAEIRLSRVLVALESGTAAREVR